jgi:hypothetical protein
VKANRVFRRSDSKVATGAVDALLNSITAQSASRVPGLQQQQQCGTRRPAKLPGVAAAVQRHNMEGWPAPSFFDWDSPAVPGSHSYSGSGAGGVGGVGGGFYRGTSHHSVSDGGGRISPKHWPVAGKLNAERRAAAAARFARPRHTHMANAALDCVRRVTLYLVNDVSA